jgi:eukaryotic translation initiation factor 2-alpha kinase 4
VIEVINQTKSSPSQKRALLLKQGLLRGIVDELEALTETGELSGYLYLISLIVALQRILVDDIDAFMSKIEKVSPVLSELIDPSAQELKRILQYAKLMGVSKTFHFHPLMLGSHHVHFKDGFRFEVVRRSKRIDVLAAGGQYVLCRIKCHRNCVDSFGLRYNSLISRYSPPTVEYVTVCAVGMQINVEKITMALANFQMSSVKSLIKEQRSFGFWSPRRCDVYVVSYHPGYLLDRLEVVSYLWQHNISADIMYESGLPDAEHENPIDICVREGILYGFNQIIGRHTEQILPRFTVYPRPRSGRRDQPAFKVKSVLKGTEYDRKLFQITISLKWGFHLYRLVSRPELVGWLLHEITEQKRIDMTTSGAPSFVDNAQSPLPIKEVPTSSNIQLILPSDIKKQRKYVKQLHYDRGQCLPPALHCMH